MTDNTRPNVSGLREALAKYDKLTTRTSSAQWDSADRLLADVASDELPALLAYIERLEAALTRIRDYDVAAHSKHGFETIDEQALSMYHMRDIAREALAGSTKPESEG